MSYTVWAVYSGYDQVLDRKIEGAATRRSDGSGYGFGGMRDISFTFATKRGADNAVKRINRLGLGVRAYAEEE